MDDDETEEIVEIKDLEYIPHSAKDTVWLQKKWSFILFVLAVNLGNTSMSFC